MCQGATALTLMPWRPCGYAMSAVITISPPLAAFRLLAGLKAAKVARQPEPGA
jgi:hypothetical protein